DLRARGLRRSPLGAGAGGAAGPRAATRPTVSARSGVPPAPDDRHEAHALPRVAAQVVRQSEARVLGLPWARFAAQLEPHLVHHPQPRGADRGPERLETTVRVHRQLAFELEVAVEHVAPGGAARAEAEVLIEDELGRREAVVDLRHADLAAWIRDPGL